MTANARLSIIINNFNYERFLPAAIQSALDQTWAETEVIVVDDGSSDGSASVIQWFGDAVIPVFKENGGQASAINVGFRASSGDAVIFLDADDVLESHIGERVMAIVNHEPDVAKIQFRLRMIDGDGEDLGAVVPPSWQLLPNGDLRSWIVRHRSYVYPPTSGNAFTRAALKEIWPIPETTFRISADQYLHHATPLVGTVRALDTVGGRYRLHQSNHYVTREIDLNRVRTEIVISRDGHPFYREIAERTGLYAYPRTYLDVSDRILFGLRLTSLKLDPGRHPVPGDSVFRLGIRGILATVRAPDSSLARKLFQSIWFAGVALLPRRQAAWIVLQRMQVNTPAQRSDSKESGRVRSLFVRLISRKSGNDIEMNPENAPKRGVGNG